MLLFFFMVVTVLREHQLLLKVEIPRASQVQKLKHRSLVQKIYVGHPRKESESKRPVIQINDAYKLNYAAIPLGQ